MLGILPYNDEPYLTRLRNIGNNPFRISLHLHNNQKSYNIDKKVCFNTVTRAQDVIQNNSLCPPSKHLSSYSLNLWSRL